MNEEKTSIEKLANMNLEGLLLPDQAPASYGWIWLIIGLLILITVMAWVKKYRSPKATALRSLKQLQKDLSIDGYDTQNIKKQIARSLRQGFSVTRLDHVMPDNIKWRKYLSTLETALYANKPSESQPQSKVLSSLIKNAQAWLRAS